MCARTRACVCKFVNADRQGKRGRHVDKENQRCPYNEAVLEGLPGQERNLNIVVHSEAGLGGIAYHSAKTANEKNQRTYRY